MDEYFGGRRWNRGKREEVLIAARKTDIAKLFGVSKHTIDAWTRDKKLDIRSLRSICELYTKRKLRKEDTVSSTDEAVDMFSI
jgi:transposase